MAKSSRVPSQKSKSRKRKGQKSSYCKPPSQSPRSTCAQRSRHCSALMRRTGGDQSSRVPRNAASRTFALISAATSSKRNLCTRVWVRVKAAGRVTVRAKAAGRVQVRVKAAGRVQVRVKAVGRVTVRVKAAGRVQVRVKAAGRVKVRVGFRVGFTVRVRVMGEGDG